MRSMQTPHAPHTQPLRTLTHLLALVALVMLALPGLALAQEKAGKGKKGARVLSFEEDHIEGQYQKPGGENIQSLNKKKRQSLIRVRTDFYAEIVRSARDL